MLLGNTFEDVSATLFDNDAIGLTRRDIKAAYGVAEMFAGIDGSPRTVYGFVNGLTRFSQNSPYADARERLDRAAGRIMNLVDVSA